MEYIREVYVCVFVNEYIAVMCFNVISVMQEFISFFFLTDYIQLGVTQTTVRKLR